MQRRITLWLRTVWVAGIALLGGAGLQCVAEQPSAAASAAYNAYADALATRLARQHASAAGFLAGPIFDPEQTARLRRGEPIVERLTPTPADELPGALLHHWRATAFVSGATAAQFEKVLRNFSAYPQVFAPQVLKASVAARDGDKYAVLLRARQKHVLTVTMDTGYEVRFGQLDPQHRCSTSHSIRMAEIGADGRPLPPSEEHGYLWRQDTWWSYEERDGGLYLQVESVSLTRGIPAGLGWALKPLVESVPRDSLEFTLRAASNALRNLRVQAHGGR